MSRLEYIPLDFIKVRLTGLVKDEFEERVNLSFIPCYGELGEMRYKYAKYRNMQLRIYESGRIILSGSLHRFFNRGEHNHNDFGFDAFKAVLRQLKADLGVLPSDMRIISLEYGVNADSPICVTDCLNHLLFHKRSEFGVLKRNTRGVYIEVIHSCYRIKIYDKGKQYGVSDQLIRVEIKQTNWSEYRLVGITTLQDFINTDKGEFLHNLLSRWKEMLFFDPTIQNSGRWEKYRDPNFWRDIFKKSRPAVKKHVDRLIQLNRTSVIDVQEKIARAIELKVYELQKG